MASTSTKSRSAKKSRSGGSSRSATKSQSGGSSRSRSSSSRSGGSSRSRSSSSRSGGSSRSRNGSRSATTTGETDRYRRAAEDALQQLDWAIGYLHGIKKTGISKALAQNRSYIRRKLMGEADEPLPDQQTEET